MNKSPPPKVRLGDLEEAAAVVGRAAVRTPLVRLWEPPAGPDDVEIWLKLEILQPVGSFKLRGATSVVRRTDPHQLAQGLVTASTGNLAQAVAWEARRLGVGATVVVPDHAPEAKRAAIERLGARTIPVPLERWWQTLAERGHPDATGLFIDPEDPRLIAGNGTIGLEILADLPDVDTVVVPYGGGALSVGIATAIRALRPSARVYAVEPETAAPLTAAFTAGGPTEIDYRPSWIDGCGGSALLPNMWPAASELLDGAIAVPLEDAAASIRILAERANIVAEGAGALSVAATLAGSLSGTKIACIISGASIDTGKLQTILTGRTPA